MTLKRLLTESAQFVAASIISIFLAVIGINAVGFLISGRSPGYDSAQGGGTLYFFISLFLGPPIGVAVAIAWMSYLKKRKR